MAQITIDKCKDRDSLPQRLLDDVRKIKDSIRQRAYGLFESRDASRGSDVEDWLQAERDLLWSPASELVDEGKEFRARIALPGFEAKDIHVTALPHALVVEAGATHTHDGTEGNVCFCEFSEKKLFRQIELPATVDVDKISASLDKGILQVSAPKAAPQQLAASA